MTQNTLSDEGEEYMTNQVPQEEWAREFLQRYGGDVMYPENYKNNQDKLTFIRTHLSQVREQGRREGYMEAVRNIPDKAWFNTGMSANYPHPVILTEIKEELKAKLESKERDN